MFKKIIKRIGAFMLLLAIYFYFYNSEYLQKSDYKIYDTMMQLSNYVKKENDFYTVIVNIDEKSLELLGQWPWSRVINANLVDNIADLNPSALGVNIFFPEVDRISPLNIQKFYEKFFNLEVAFRNIPEALKDNDALFAQSIQHANATLSTYFYDNGTTAKHCDALLYHENILKSRETKFKVNSLLCNYNALQKKSQDFGFVNAWKDSDGIFRRIPLFMEYKEKIFPSFALATIMSFDQERYQDLSTDSMLLHFPVSRPKIFSAIDILNGSVPSEEIRGKIVILGTSLIGLNSTYKTPTGVEISNSMIHALAIESMLSNDFLRQAPIYQKINLLISFLLLLFIFYLFKKKVYFKIFTLLVTTFIISFIWAFDKYLDNIYISIGYFWVTFLVMFVGIFIYHLRERSCEQQEQEAFLVRQSKLASMGEMISLIAHQWRQPLSAINGTVLAMDMDYRKKNLQAENFDNYLNDIEEMTGYLSRTINDFTDFFSKNKEAQLFTMATLLRQANQLTEHALSDKITLSYEANEHIKVKGYPSELLQSLLILLNNAIYICKEKLEEIGEGRIVIEVQERGKRVVISVEDNGGGIAKKDMKKIFSPYFTTKSKQNGTGLGLYILKMIVEDSLDGIISVRNGKEGAIFSIEIPRNMD